jgi:pimeloyl-ACP methyl ester carboxylesterase
MDSGGPGGSEHRWITSGRATLHAVRVGPPGAPAGVLLHEGISDHRMWAAVMDGLGPDMDLVAYDRRGFGTTTYQPEAHDQVEDLSAVLRASGMEQAVLFGNSLGGAIALDFALAHPDRVTALVLTAPGVSGAPGPDADTIDPVEAAVWRTLEEADEAGDLEALNRGEIRFWLDGPHAPEGRVPGPPRELALDMNRIALHADEPGHEPNVTNAWDRLEEVRCPVLVLVGDLDLGRLRERSGYLAAHLPDAELVVLEGTAHLPALEQPAEYGRIVRRFLERTGILRPDEGPQTRPLG